MLNPGAPTGSLKFQQKDSLLEKRQLISMGTITKKGRIRADKR